MTADWTFNLDVGPLSWSIGRGDPPTLPEVLDGFRTGWTTPESNTWPAQPEPQVAVFSLLAADAADFAGIQLGTDVYAELLAGLPADEPSAVFGGTVGAMDGRPRRFLSPDTGDFVDGWQLDIQAVEYTARLGEENVSGETTNISDTPGSVAIAPIWIIEYLTQVGAAPVDTTFIADGDTTGTACLLTIISDAVESATLGDALENVLRQTADGGAGNSLYEEQGWRRGIVRANLYGGVQDPETPWVVEWVSSRNPTSLAFNTLPARFALLTGGLYGPELHALADDGSTILEADYLIRDVAWTRTKATEPERIIVTTKVDLATAATTASGDLWRKVTRTATDAAANPITAQVEDTQLTISADAERVGDMYLGAGLGPADRWQPAGFSWVASEDPDWPMRLSWFPQAPGWIGWAVPVVIAGVPATQQPNGRPWQVGIPDAVEMVIAGGRFGFDFTLLPRVPRPFNNGSALTFDDLAADFPAVTHDDLDPSFTSTDYRLVRSSALD